MHRLCVRCGQVAGFWVRRMGGTVRLPWCLACISKHLDLSQVTVTRFSGGQRPGIR